MSPLWTLLLFSFLPYVLLAETITTEASSSNQTLPTAATVKPSDRVNNGFFGFGVVAKLSAGEWTVIIILVVLGVISGSLMTHFMLQCVRERAHHEEQLQSVAVPQSKRNVTADETKSSSSHQ